MMDGGTVAVRRSGLDRLRQLVESKRTQQTVATLIVVNGVILGLETSAAAMAAAGDVLRALDWLIVAVFVAEILAKLAVFRLGFFRDPWNVFDFVVIGISLVPATHSVSVLRALRVLRVLRLVSAVPSMRRVVEGLLRAIPGMGAIAGLLVLLFYVFGVMATKLFGAAFPEWFGTLPRSMYSLFQIMTLESWSMGIVRPVMEVYPTAWAFFVPFILVTAFAVLNLFIAVIVNAMQSEHEAEHKAAVAEVAAAGHADAARLEEELRSLTQEIRELRATLTTDAGGSGRRRPIDAGRL
jgi:voltage-gated sodium channel